MRGTIFKRYKNSWSIVLDLDPKIDPKTGGLKRNQKWISVKGTKRDAENRLNEILGEAAKGTFVEPSKVTLQEWLVDWLAKAVKPPARRASTYTSYKHIVEKVIGGSFLASIPLQRLKAADLKRFYVECTVSQSTQVTYHGVLHSALKAAMLEGVVQRNVAALVVGKPKRTLRHEDIRLQCWAADEARTFLVVARAAGPMQAAFYTIAIEAGLRKAELCGLRWKDVDLDAGKLRVIQQLVRGGATPTFGPTKTGTPRTIDVSPGTVQLLRTHKSHQAEIKLKNRRSYHDHDLVFAKEWSELSRKHDVLGQPLQMNNLGEREYAKLIKAAGVRAITFHGLRHTCATLLFAAGVPIKVIQERLGHKRIEVTLDIYAHVLPSMQRDAAAKLSSLLA